MQKGIVVLNFARLNVAVDNKIFNLTRKEPSTIFPPQSCNIRAIVRCNYLGVEFAWAVRVFALDNCREDVINVERHSSG